jgi:acyl carrier protein
VTTSPEVPDRQAVLDAVKRMVARESRLSIDPRQISDDEPLDGPLLRITSMGLLGMLIRLEGELSITLPDDIFVGQVMHTVADLARVVGSVAGRHDAVPGVEPAEVR